MGDNHRKAYVAFVGLLCAAVAGCTSPAPAVASQREHPSQHTAKAPVVFYPSQDFGTFLRRYADSADDSVHRSFTDDPLEYEVATHTVEKETDASPTTHLSRRTGLSRLELFPYRYFKDAKVFDRVVLGEMKPERQSKVGYPVSIQTMAGDGRSVDFGMEYEVDTYVFRGSQGCWYLSRAINLRD
ncbi:hypothetical protein [Xanthomonas hortorum]|uniref:Lipoprotein n=1 Tax=Xanthomonas hortorum pv. pelargonii TaxID=453602 RepID=A0A6V7BBP8_9XANT|nr:hypothetical protein [Xanthomonas hortorum]MCE4356592.1 hypothetical protein [Xanthomonas hortorum pv. pelargonii]MCM5526512.1 hypothetical protein [Xanthomonas hortorum pv. pelargonii]MCM5538521.1 hypothetical protein [Xanthomonas hortorum pv. pelargonii]MCM5540658.1 hypothetical protein [Xanthomonas hortorum pv. pelargonii]MCM5546805.1 hypothetical protein [Xanthomonas hortorum pv. pelargonii]